MKQHTIFRFAAMAALLLGFTACSDHDIERELTPPGVPGDNSTPPGSLTFRAAVSTTPGTRLGHTYNGRAMDVEWTDGSGDTKTDAFRMYEESTTADTGVLFTLFTINEDKSADFTGAELNPGIYQAFYPAWRFTGQKQGDLVFDVTTQKQGASGDTRHLTDNNYMTLVNAVTVGDQPKSSDLNFQHEVAIIRYYISLPEASEDEKLRSLVVSVDTDTPDASNGFKTVHNVNGGAHTYASSMTLHFDEEEAALEADKYFVAYLTVLPSTLSGNLTLAVTTTATTYLYITAISSGTINYEAGNIYSNNTAVMLSYFGSEFDATVAAGNGIAFTTGSGTVDNPYLIEEADHLKFLVEQVNAGNVAYNAAHYKLTTDIRVTAPVWTPIGSSAHSFEGTFDGGNNTISGRLEDNNDIDLFGFFGKASNAKIKDLTVNAVVKAKNDNNYCFVGGVAGQIENSTVISGCHSLNSVTSSSSFSFSLAGGIVGYSVSDNSISNCVNWGSISASSDYSPTSGGIVGYSRSESSISDCTNWGSVFASAATNSIHYSGGIVGQFEGIVFTGNTTANSDITVGGIDNNDSIGAFIGNASNISEIDNGNKIEGGGFSGMRYIGNQTTLIP